MGSGPSLSGIPGDYIGTIYPERWTHNEQQVKDFAYTFAQLILAYNSADVMERISLDFSPLDFTGDGYVEMLGIISAKRQEVIERNNKLAEFAKYAGDEIGYINIPASYSPFATYAIGAENAVDRALRADTTTKTETSTKEEIKKKIMEQIDLIKAAYPDKKRFEIINARLGLAGKDGIARMEERSTDDVKEAQEVIAHNNKWEARYNTFQTTNKIILYTAAAPEAIVAGWAVKAAYVFLWGVDIGVSVWDTIDIIVNGDKENTLRKHIKNETSAVGNTYTNVMMIKDVLSLIKNPKQRTADELITVLGLVAGEVDPENALILNVSEGWEMTIHYADELPEELWLKGQTLNDFDTPPNLLQYNGDVRRYQIAYDNRKSTKEWLQRSDIKVMIAKLKKIREEKLAADAEERARKEAEYQKINAAADQARKRAELNKRAQSDPELKETLEKLNIDTTPPPAPVVPTTPSIPSRTISDCGTCFNAGMSCICGRAACRCCANNDDGCNGFDL